MKGVVALLPLKWQVKYWARLARKKLHNDPFLQAAVFGLVTTSGVSFGRAHEMLTAEIGGAA